MLLIWFHHLLSLHHDLMLLLEKDIVILPRSNSILPKKLLLPALLSMILYERIFEPHHGVGQQLLLLLLLKKWLELLIWSWWEDLSSW